MPPRATCPRCQRPQSVCVCSTVRTVDSRTHVVFVQHPREARMPVSTCRLAHLSLPNSEMYVAMSPERIPRLVHRLTDPGTMVLFPGPGSIDVTELTTPPRRIIVVDGTWINARKLVERSPLLSAFPRLGFTPATPSNYRIRKEPAAHCLSTIEAVAFVLEALEGAPGAFAPILGSFTRMVDLQLAHVGTHSARPGVRPIRVAPATRIRALGDRLVLLAAEAGGLGDDAQMSWVAVRPSTGERFTSLVRPDRPLGPHIPDGIDVPFGAALEPFADALARWQSFARPDDIVGTWGRFHTVVLADQGVIVGERLDMKHFFTDALHRRVGGVEVLAAEHGAAIPMGIGRMGRVLMAMEVVLRALLAGTLRKGS